VFKETPAEDLTKAICHARLSRSKLLLNDVFFICYNNEERRRSRTPLSHKNDVQPVADNDDRRRVEIVLHPGASIPIYRW